MTMTTPAGPVAAPSAPGRMGEPVDPPAARAYVDALGRWRDGRRSELEQLDRVALDAAASRLGRAAGRAGPGP